ncbi:endoglin-like isoform X2 [Brienomyrus brachyistius]|uniref:endoglin-like isoform X2 n=1 Tax=Brienomyrus brachyistius TaxID=42636 RepID=UPI0020B3E423|nr:endoglin-like isoform X2 [Brienomyrus brachyistius]
METIAALLCLLILGEVSSASLTCEPKEPGDNSREKGIDVDVTSGMSPRCWSRYKQEGFEVHILDLVFSSNSSLFFIMDFEKLNKVHVVLKRCSETPLQVFKRDGTPIKFHDMSNTTDVHEDHVVYEICHMNILELVTKRFGGVTSFTTIYDPSEVIFTGKQADINSVECIPEKGFFPKQYLLYDIKNPAFKQPFKLCSSDNAAPGKKMHIINIPDSVPIQEVFIHVISDNETALFLRGPSGTVWNVEEPFKLISNNQVQMKFNGSQITVEPSIENVIDSYMDVQHLAMKKMGLNFMYVEITAAISKIRLVIKEPTSLINGSNPQIPPGSASMQLFESADYKTHIDPMAKVQSEKRIYAEISSRSEEVELAACSVRSRDSCRVELPIPFQVEHCPWSICQNRIRFSLSFQQIQDAPSTAWDLECKVKVCLRQSSDMKCHDEDYVKVAVEVVKSSVPSASCPDFNLSAVLGVAFGGFLIGVLLMGALWFIKVRTDYLNC